MRCLAPVHLNSRACNPHNLQEIDFQSCSPSHFLLPDILPNSTMLLTRCEVNKVSGKLLSEAVGDWVGMELQVETPEEYMTHKKVGPDNWAADACYACASLQRKNAQSG